jgi:hypothetical protein
MPAPSGKDAEREVCRWHSPDRACRLTVIGARDLRWWVARGPTAPYALRMASQIARAGRSVGLRQECGWAVRKWIESPSSRW